MKKNKKTRSIGWKIFDVVFLGVNSYLWYTQLSTLSAFAVGIGLTAIPYTWFLLPRMQSSIDSRAELIDKLLREQVMVTAAKVEKSLKDLGYDVDDPKN